MTISSPSLGELIAMYTVECCHEDQSIPKDLRNSILEFLLISFKRQLNVNFFCFDDVIMSWLLQLTL